MCRARCSRLKFLALKETGSGICRMNNWRQNASPELHTISIVSRQTVPIPDTVRFSMKLKNVSPSIQCRLERAVRTVLLAAGCR